MADWDKITSRGNVEDRRSFAPVVGGISLTGLALYLLFNVLTGGSLSDVLGGLQNVQVQPSEITNPGQYEGQDSYEKFASAVLGSNNDMWEKVFKREGRSYKPPRLVLFRTATESGCGTATSEVGPHYCPYDETIYLDETFFDELTNRFGAKGGDVAEAYVIAHEVGHHAQNELGIMDSVQEMVNKNKNEVNNLSLKLELQADCFAGMWANSIKDAGVLQPGEISEAMDAAAAVGDDRIQQKVTGRIDPETWTHGSSEQRVAAFDTGYETGELVRCDTFR